MLKYDAGEGQMGEGGNSAVRGGGCVMVALGLCMGGLGDVKLTGWSEPG